MAIGALGGILGTVASGIGVAQGLSNLFSGGKARAENIPYSAENAEVARRALAAADEASRYADPKTLYENFYRKEDVRLANAYARQRIQDETRRGVRGNNLSQDIERALRLSEQSGRINAINSALGFRGRQLEGLGIAGGRYSNIGQLAGTYQPYANQYANAQLSGLAGSIDKLLGSSDQNPNGYGVVRQPVGGVPSYTLQYGTPYDNPYNRPYYSYEPLPPFSIED